LLKCIVKVPVVEAVKEKLQMLENEETNRLEEALNCYVTGCCYAAIAMSVSAIEFRLLNLMQSVKPNPQLQQIDRQVWLLCQMRTLKKKIWNK